MKNFLLAMVGFLIIGLSLFYLSRSGHEDQAASTNKTITAARSDVSDAEYNAAREAILLAGEKPVVTGVKMEFESTLEKDILKVIARGVSKNGEPVTFAYRWTKNEQPAGEGDTASGYKRGDVMSVKIVPYNGKAYGESKISTLTIGNTPTKITAIKEIAADAQFVTLKVDAHDLDGDVLSYSLVDAPEGATIDQNGIIRLVLLTLQGKVAFKVKITDGHGGEAIGPVVLETAVKK